MPELYRSVCINEIESKGWALTPSKYIEFIDHDLDIDYEKEIGFNDTEKTFIITFNDNVFRIKETAKKKILDTYLFMYLCRKEWDRYAEFISWGSEKVSDVVGYIKGKSALMIHDKYPESVNGWSKAFWARGYYVATVGNITEDAVKEYIQQQKEESKREDTRR